MRAFLRLIPTAAAALLLSLCFAVTCHSQSMPGYQAPAKPKPTEESLQTKAARGQAPLRNLYEQLKVDSSKTKHLPALDVREKEKKAPSKALRIGAVRSLPEPINPATDGTMYQIAEGDVRVMSVVSAGALYTRLQFSKMALPPGARVFVYSMKNPDEFYGPYEDHGAAENGTFWTPPISGDGVVIEYFVPKSASGLSGKDFKVSKITHVFTDPVTLKVGGCHNDVAAPWTDTAKSVGMLDFVSGSSAFQCTGTLLADQPMDAIPYVLTAHHCISTQTEAQSLRVWWNYNTGDSPPPGTPFTDGSNLLVTGTPSDFTFLRLTGSLPGGLFFSGWDATTFSGSASSAGIHHPDGSYKRISFGNARQPTSQAECDSLGGAGFQCVAVNWTSGVTEPGSSGSGLWKGLPTDPGGARLIGTLTGGPSVCGGADLRDGYGRFSVTYPSISSFLEGTNCVTSLNPTSQNISGSGGAGSFTVNAPGGCSWTAVPGDTFVNITSGASGNGSGTVNFSVASNGGPQRSTTIVVGGQVFNITQGGGGACAATPISFGQTINGNLSTSDCPLDDGSFYDVYSFSATAGTQVSVLMQASFDTFLFLNNPDGSLLAFDDDGGGGTNSRILTTLPTTGTYTIWANSYDPGVTGPYSLTLNGTAPVPRTLTVASLNPNSGVSITVTPNDNNGQNNGTTQFTRTYNQNVTVTLTAPGSVPGGNVFQEWRRDGSSWASSVTTSVTMNADHTMTAVYGPPITHTLTVASLNPTSGVGITVSPNDNSGFGNGTTQFTRTYNHNTTVTLNAIGVTSEGNIFKRWLKNGSVFNGLQTAIIDMTSDITMTAEYSIKPKIYGEDSNPTAAVAVNSVTYLRGPFQILDSHNFATDGHTRLIIFTNDLGLTNPPLNDAAVLRVEIAGSSVPIEAYGTLTGTPGLAGSYIVVRLPDGLQPNTSVQLVVWLFGYSSDPKTLTIQP